MVIVDFESLAHRNWWVDFASKWEGGFNKRYFLSLPVAIDPFDVNVRQRHNTGNHEENSCEKRHSESVIGV